jgi:biopolymer transport protein ExbD
MPAKRVSATLNPAPMMSLFLILSAIVAAERGPSRGHTVDVARPSNDTLCNDRTVIADVLSSGQVRINQVDVRLENLGLLLVQIFRNRAERVMVVSADRDAAFSQVTAVIDASLARVDRVALVTHTVLRGSRGCGPVWPVRLVPIERGGSRKHP